MGKDPAFLFYPGDWLGGTIGMTLEEKGAYMELLMMQFTRGHMTSHMIGQAVGQLWVKVQDKFIQDSKGLWYNARLDLEKANRKNFTDSRKNNLSGTNQYSKKASESIGHMTSHMEDEDTIENRLKEGVNETLISNLKPLFPNIDVDREVKIFKAKVLGAKDFYQGHTSSGLGMALNAHLRGAKPKRKETPTDIEDLERIKNQPPPQNAIGTNPQGTLD